MAEELTNDQIALLCDIGDLDLSKLPERRRGDLERLISEGYLEPSYARSASKLKLTAKGMEFLGVRGVGLNEA